MDDIFYTLPTLEDSIKLAQESKKKIAKRSGTPWELILEFPGRIGGCPQKCNHCIHREPPKNRTSLDPDEIRALLEKARLAEIKKVTLYPHDDDICLPPFNHIIYLQLAQQLGFDVKTITSAVNPKGVKMLLPHINRLSISIDSLDKVRYGTYRDNRFFDNVIKSLKVVGEYRESHKLNTTALMVAGDDNRDTIYEDAEKIKALSIFDKVKVRELLPLGGAKKSNEIIF